MLAMPLSVRLRKAVSVSATRCGGMLAIALQLFCFITNAQQPPCPGPTQTLGDFTFTSQGQVTTFADVWGRCADIIVDNLVIGYESGDDNSDVTDIAALANIKTVRGNIIIRRATNLTTLNGLDNITSFSGDLRIEKCYTLTDITALSGITQAGYLNIRDNSVLPNLNGLHNLTQLSNYLYIRNNATLTDVNALQNLTSVGNYIEVFENAVLTNISGLQNIVASSISGAGLVIKDNPELAVCNLSNFCTYLSGPGNRDISGNKTTCLNAGAVTAACASACASVSGMNFTFNTQASINNFGAMYGHCTDIILGDVRIEGNDITDLSPLANVKTITGYLQIVNNPNLLSLDGLNGFLALESIGQYLNIRDNDQLEEVNGFPVLTSIGTYLSIRTNENLENINGFPALTSIGTFLNIENNIELKTISGFNNLNSVGTDVSHYLRFTDNPELTEISGFGSLTTVRGFFQIRNSPDLATVSAFGSLSNVWEFAIQSTKLANLDNFSNLTTLGGSKLAIEGNSQLTDISGLANVSSATIGGGAGLFIANNPELSVCNLPDFCAYLSGSGARTISGNKTTCRNEQAVIAACDPCLTASLWNFEFNTQAELNEFAALYAHCADITLANVNIQGNDITDLSPLENVKTIKGYLQIRNNPNLLSLDGLNALASIGEFLSIENNANLENINGFPALTSIGTYLDILINANLKNINGFRALTSIGKELSIWKNASLEKIDGFPALTSIAQCLSVSHSENLEEINGFPVLASIGTYLYITSNAKLQELNGFPALTSIGQYLSIGINDKLQEINGFPALTSIGQYLNIHNNVKLQKLKGFSVLTGIGGFLSINTNANLENINGFPALTSIGTYLAIRSNPVLTDISGLQNINSNSITGRTGLVIENNPQLEVCHLSNICAYLSTSKPRTISGNKTTCTDEQAIITACATACASVSGMDFTFNTQASINNFGAMYAHCSDIILRNVVIGYASISLSDITDLSPLANVKTITGHLIIRNNPSLLSINGLTTLTSIGQYLAIRENAKLKEINGFPALISTGSALLIELNDKLENIDGFPALTSTGMALNISSNANLENIDGFSALTSIGRFLVKSNDKLGNIDGFPALTSVAGDFLIQSNGKLENIDGFPALTSIGTFLNIENNIGLKTISGFNNLNSVGTDVSHYLRFTDNPELTEISGFGSLASVSGDFHIRDNPDLATLSAFGSLTSVGREFWIQKTALADLDNFSSLTTLGGLKLAVEDNDNLTDISGLANVNPVTIGVLHITNNPELSICNLPNFCTYLSGPGARTIGGNKTTCIDEQAVLEACIPFGPDNNNILYVNRSVSGGNNKGYSWENAVPQLADALKYARQQNNYTSANPLKIFVAKGTYKPMYNAHDGFYTAEGGRSNAFVMVNNVQIYGGFDPENNIDDLSDTRIFGSGGSILSGEIEAINTTAFHVVISSGAVETALLDGFTITRGGVILPVLTTISVNGNHIMSDWGGGISNISSSPAITNCTFTENATYIGGGMYNRDSSPTVTNCLFTGNAATNRGGGICNNYGNGTFINVTMANNGSDGFYIQNGKPVLQNSIIWDAISRNSYTATYSLMKDLNPDGTGNIDAISLVGTDIFTDPTNGDYTLKSGSPAVNAGGNALFTGLDANTKDLAGNPRLLRHHIDLGAYESDCSGSVLTTDAEVTRPLLTGDNYLYSSCDLLAMVRPENANGPITVSTVSEDDLIAREKARYVRRHYQISAENAGTTDVTLYFTQADFDHYNSTFGEANDAKLPDNLRIARYPDGYTLEGTSLTSTGEPIYIEPSTAPQWNASLELWEVTFTTPGFSGFFVTGQSDAALPVRLAGFTAKAEEQSVVLTWQTASEVNFSHFEPERSRDGKQWQKLDAIPATGGNERGAEYRYRDQSPLSGLSYYRLKMVDLATGHQGAPYEYSTIRSVVVQKGSDRRLLVYPNPTTGRVYVKADGEIKEVLLWDIAGRLVKKQRYQGVAGISLDGLASGMLLVEVRLADGTSRIGRVVVQP